VLPSVTKARYVKDYLIEVKFNDGKKKVIDFEPWLTGPIFKPLKSKAYFKKSLLMVRPSLAQWCGHCAGDAVRSGDS
jgi:Protein of unknown function (DUF2442)